MPITYDITTDGLYLEGKEVGIDLGHKKGSKDTTDQLIIRALKLGKNSIEEIAEIANVEVSYVLELQQRLQSDS